MQIKRRRRIIHANLTAVCNLSSHKQPRDGMDICCSYVTPCTFTVCVKDCKNFIPTLYILLLSTYINGVIHLGIALNVLRKLEHFQVDMS